MEVNKFSELVKCIYSIPLSADALPVLLEKMADILHCDAVGIHVLDRNNLDVIALPTDEIFERHFQQMRPHILPLKVSGQETDDSYLFKNGELLKLHQAESLLSKPSEDSVLSLLLKENGYWIQLCFRVEGGVLDFSYLSHCLNLLRPHLKQMFDIAQFVEQCRLKRHGLQQALDYTYTGVVLFDGMGKPLFFNRKAKTMLNEYQDVIPEAWDIMNHGSDFSKSLQPLIRSALASEGKDKSAIGVTNLLLKRHVPAVVIPMAHIERFFVSHEIAGAEVALIIGAQSTQDSAAVDVYQLLFGLTLPEAKLAMSLQQGLSLSEHCEKSGVSIHTARSYLKLIFQKTGVNRQAELVSLLSTVPLVSL